jgi:hypothetical protein
MTNSLLRRAQEHELSTMISRHGSKKWSTLVGMDGSLRRSYRLGNVTSNQYEG